MPQLSAEDKGKIIDMSNFCIKRKTDARFNRTVCWMVLANRFACAADILKVIPHEGVPKYTIY
jgi:hypothetical protein